MTQPLLIGSISKALLALQKLGQAGVTGRSLAHLAAELGLNKGSLHHTLTSLRHHGFVEQDSNGNYRLGREIPALASSYMQDESLRSLLHDGICVLSQRINEICHLGVLFGEDIVYIDKILPDKAMNTWSTVGWRNPALCTALGRAIVSQMFVDFRSFSQQFPTPLLQRTPNTRATLKSVWQELTGAMQRGFAREEQEYVLETSCVAVAILRGTKAVGAISVTGPPERISRKYEQDLVAALHECIQPHLPVGLRLQKPLNSRVPPSEHFRQPIPIGLAK